MNKEKFSVLFAVGFWNPVNSDYFKGISEFLNLSKFKVKKIILELQKEKLIEIEYRENRFYATQLTKEGDKIYKDENYLKWKEELGY